MTKLAIWDVTSRCNLRCIHCGVGDIYSRHRPAGVELTYQDGLAILHRLHEVGYRRLMLLGGEPLLRSDVALLVAAARQAEFSHVGLTTNGTRLTPQLADTLLKAGLDAFIVSLDGATARSNDQLRGSGAYDQTIRGLETMLRQRPASSKLQIDVQLTLNRLNMHETAMMVDLAVQMGLDGLRLNELRLVGNAQRHAERLLPSLGEAMDARESALQAAGHYPNLNLHMFGRPLTIEYFNERFGTVLTLPTTICSLANGGRVLYVGADGSASACGAIHVQDATLVSEQNPIDKVERLGLHTHSLSSILASPRFDRVKRLVNQSLEEKWQDEIIPCVRCRYRSICQMCPLFLRAQKEKIARECLLAVQRQARWRKSRGRVTQVASEP